jgi:hypothetical protein
VAVRDDGDGECAVALLGQQQHCPGMRAIDGMGWRVRLVAGARGQQC